MSEGRVEALYNKLKDMAVDFRIRPGERINEVALARELDASRTPLREALNRLVGERLIDFNPGKGFFCRPLDPETIHELYELREIIEVASVRLACKRASSEGIETLRQNLEANGLTYIGKTVREVTAFDEAFHMEIARLSGNKELERQLSQINERIRFVRWVDMSARVKATKNEHKQIMSAIEDRDSDRAAKVMQAHIEKRLDQIVMAVKESYSNIYMPGAEELFDRQFAVEEN
ncbi:MAG: GntR family transcriptional regulator [Pseudomonadota bacterium]